MEPAVLMSAFADALLRWESRIIPAMSVGGVSVGFDNTGSAREGAVR